ncbi:MAG TPA: hypothetical protein VFJ17_09390 [Mycobacteriales bacterium]|jgi:hypothetical protein|nr:hypothetical protein [Mycobacteriales bacterium]
MIGVKRRLGRAAIATAMSTGMIGVGIAVAPAASAGASGTFLHVAITSHGMYVKGPTTFPAGRVSISIDAAGGDRAIEIVRLHSGYSFADFRSDVKTALTNLEGSGGDTKAGLKALNHAIANITAFGGLDAHDGQLRHGAVVLPSAGNRYVLFDDSSLVPRRPVRLTVTAPAGPQTLPATSATVVAREDRRWGGATTLPSHGNIKFANHADVSPHFVVLQHVKDGTTRKQVIDSFSSPNPPDFVLPGDQSSDIVSPGHAMAMHLQLPPGTYALMCFFPDPQTGMPHAFMGMVRIVTLT